MEEKATVTLEVTAKITDEFIEFQSNAIGMAFGRWGYKKSDIERALMELEKYKCTKLTPEKLIELKERDTAKMPEIHKNKWFNVYTCPSCNLNLINKDVAGWFCGKHYRFCPDCGQRLRWED